MSQDVLLLLIPVTAGQTPMWVTNNKTESLNSQASMSYQVKMHQNYEYFTI